MNQKKILAITAVVAGTALIAYFLKRRNQSLNNIPSQPRKPSHHRTNVFSRAKEHLVM